MALLLTDFILVSSARMGTDQETVEYFSMRNVTMYANAGSSNMTYPYSSYWDEGPPGEWDLTTPGQYLEFWWNYDWIYPKHINLRHIEERGWMGPTGVDHVYWLIPNGTVLRGYNQRMSRLVNLYATDLEAYYDSSINATYLEWECNHMSLNTLFSFDQTKYNTITEAWDGNELSYHFSYDININASSISAWTVLGQLLTFTSPNLASDPASLALSLIVAVPFWIMSAILIVKLVLALYPTAPGIPD